MKGLRKRITAGVLTAAICMTSAGAAFAASEEGEKKGFWSSVGGWFVDRGSDIGNAATTAANVTGQWFVDRGKDICEVSAIVGNWTSDRANDFVVLVTDTGEAIVCAASNFDPSVLTTKEYYLESGEKVLLGEYSDKDPTALSMGLNLAASVANVELGMDIRDLVYDVQNYGGGEVKLSGLALDAVAILPVIGVVKYFKYADTVADGVKIAGQVADTASDVAKSVDTTIDVVDGVHDGAKAMEAVEIVSDTAKAADTIDDAADTAKLADEVVDTAKAADIIDDAADTVKEITRIPLDELPEKAQETFKIYEDCAWDGEKALDDLKDGTHAGEVWGNWDEDLPVVDAAGNELSYREYDAFSLGDDPLPSKVPGGRGPCRFVRDNLGNTYFTDDHYKSGSFKLITEAIAG